MGLARGEQGDSKNIVIKHTEHIVEKPVFVEKVINIERPVFKDVEVTRAVIRDVDVVKEVPRVVYKDVFAERVVYKDVEVTRPVYRDVVIERPVFKDVIIERTQEVVRPVFKDEIIKVQKVVFEEVVKTIEVPVINHKTVYVDKPMFQERIVVKTLEQGVCAKCGHVHEQETK